MSPGSRVVAPANALPEIPEHELLGPIAAGAYGEVWLARNVIGTLRAAKIIHRRAYENTDYFEREFKGLQRFEPISRLHEGLVDVLQIGRSQVTDCFYYVMELADSVTAGSAGTGPQAYTALTLRNDLRGRGTLRLGECLTLGMKLAATLEFLHVRGLVHRDVKPSNIIFVGGEPKLADAGLVANIDDARSVVGTVGFIPPEGPGTPQADVYSLGKVLYEAAFGKDRQDFPQLPPDLRAHPDHQGLLELNEIILEACASNAQDRYSSAEQMRLDLERLERGGSIRRRHQVQRVRRLFGRRLAWLLAGGAALALVTVLVRNQQPVLVQRSEKPSTNDVANSWYDRGTAYLDKLVGTNAQMAADCFKKAAQADPNFAAAWDSLAWTYSWHTENWNTNSQLLPRARTAARRALELDPTLTRSHCVLGVYHAIVEWNWKAGEIEAQTAVRLDPSSADAHLTLAEQLRVMGRMDEALKELRVAKRLDPNSKTIALRLAGYLLDHGEFQESLRQMELVGTMDPSIDMTGLRENALCGLNRFNDAVAARLNRQGLGADERQHLEALARAVQVEGARAWWIWQLASAKQGGDKFVEAGVHAQLGETNATIACLQEDVTNHMWRLAFNLMTEWELNPVRSDPRFREVVRKIGFE